MVEYLSHNDMKRFLALMRTALRHLLHVVLALALGEQLAAMTTLAGRT